MRILHLTLVRKYFDMIASGEKQEEYREVKQYWVERLVDYGYHHLQIVSLLKYLVKYKNVYKEFDIVRFKNGYGKNAPEMDVEFKGIHYGYPKEITWVDAGKHQNWFFCIELGKILSIKNYKTINNYGNEICTIGR